MLWNKRVTLIPGVIGVLRTASQSLEELEITRRSARGVVVIVVGNGHGDTSSNPERD